MDEPEVTPTEAETLDDLEILSEQIALDSIQSEMRDTEILECLQRLEHSEVTTNPPQENPAIQGMIADLTSLKSELAELKGMLVSLQASLEVLRLSSQPRSHSEPTPEPEVINPGAPNPEESTNEPAPVAPERRKHKVI